MDDPLKGSSGIRHAVKRLSSVLSRKASTATTTLKRSKSTTFNSISSLPNKDAVLPRSALRGGRPLGIPDRRVSFYDSLPCFNYGPAFTPEAPWSKEFTDRRGGLLLPALTADDDDTDDCFREVECNDREQSATGPADLQPVARHDSSFEPVSLPRTRSVRHLRTAESLSRDAEPRRSCMDFTKAMMQEHARSQSRMRPLSLLANKVARGQSPRPSDRVLADVTFSQETHPQQSSPRTDEQIAKTEHLEKISHVYKAHVDRSLRSMQGADKRGSAYVHDALVEMQEALVQSMAETGFSSMDEDEADRAYAQAKASHRLQETDYSNASNDKTDDAISFDMPYDSAQPSAEAINFDNSTHLQPSARLQDLVSYDRFYEDLAFDPTLMPLPLHIRPRHPQRDSKVAR